MPGPRDRRDDSRARLGAARASERVVSRDMEIFYRSTAIINFYVVPLTRKAAAGGRSLRARNGRARRHPARHHREPPLDRGDDPERAALRTHPARRRRRARARATRSIRSTSTSSSWSGSCAKCRPRRGRSCRARWRSRAEEIERLDTIIQQFLGAIRPARLEPSLENLNELLRECVAFLQPEIADRNILVEQELRADLPLLELDRTQMKQAFLQRDQERLSGDEARGGSCASRPIATTTSYWSLCR